MPCDAATRPFIPENDTEIRCELDGDHDMHQSTLRDYAYPGSATAVKWHESDRRTFHGEWPGPCPENCTLPLGHRGNHAP